MIAMGLLMIDYYETNKKITMRLQGKSYQSPKHAKIMILRSVQVATFLFDKMS